MKQSDSSNFFWLLDIECLACGWKVYPEVILQQ